MDLKKDMEIFMKMNGALQLGLLGSTLAFGAAHAKNNLENGPVLKGTQPLTHQVTEGQIDLESNQGILSSSSHSARFPMPAVFMLPSLFESQAVAGTNNSQEQVSPIGQEVDYADVYTLEKIPLYKRMAPWIMESVVLGVGLLLGGAVLVRRRKNKGGKNSAQKLADKIKQASQDAGRKTDFVLQEMEKGKFENIDTKLIEKDLIERETQLENYTEYYDYHKWDYPEETSGEIFNLLSELKAHLIAYRMLLVAVQKQKSTEVQFTETKDLNEQIGEFDYLQDDFVRKTSVIEELLEKQGPDTRSLISGKVQKIKKHFYQSSIRNLFITPMKETIDVIPDNNRVEFLRDKLNILFSIVKFHSNSIENKTSKGYSTYTYADYFKNDPDSEVRKTFDPLLTEIWKSLSETQKILMYHATEYTRDFQSNIRKDPFEVLLSLLAPTPSAAKLWEMVMTRAREYEIHVALTKIPTWEMMLLANSEFIGLFEALFDHIYAAEPCLEVKKTCENFLALLKEYQEKTKIVETPLGVNITIYEGAERWPYIYSLVDEKVYEREVSTDLFPVVKRSDSLGLGLEEERIVDLSSLPEIRALRGLSAISEESTVVPESPVEVMDNSIWRRGGDAFEEGRSSLVDFDDIDFGDDESWDSSGEGVDWDSLAADFPDEGELDWDVDVDVDDPTEEVTRP